MHLHTHLCPGRSILVLNGNVPFICNVHGCPTSIPRDAPLHCQENARVSYVHPVGCPMSIPWDAPPHHQESPWVPQAGAEPGLAAGWEQGRFGSSAGGWAGSTHCGPMSPTLSIVQRLSGLYSFAQRGTVWGLGWFYRKTASR